MKPLGCNHSDCARCNGTVAKLESRIDELEATVDYMERSHNKIVGLILDIDELEQDTDEMSEAQQDLLAIAQNSAVYGVPPKYRDISGRKRIDELEARLVIDTLNPNRREHIVQLTSRIDDLDEKLDQALNDLDTKARDFLLDEWAR
jgi:DNA repair exonuclease SbcCD ATPase subunit